MDKDKYIGIGLLGSLALFLFYLVVSSLLGGFGFAISNFASLWYWMTPLVLLFGAQIGLFFYMKDEMHRRMTTEAACSTGISTASMVACCAHHIADIAPFLGITALGIFLTKYQTSFLLLGIVSNILGMIYMVGMIKSHVSGIRLKSIFYSLLALSVIIVALSFFLAPAVKQEAKNLQTLTDNQNSVEFSVTPLSISEFNIAINTHSVELAFDPVQVATLKDDSGNIYKPTAWEGSPSGGHHRNGVLRFPPVIKSAKSITLAISYNGERKFEWKLP